MKARVEVLLILVVLFLAQACAHRETLTVQDTINDRSTWVDPVAF